MNTFCPWIILLASWGLPAATAAGLEADEPHPALTFERIVIDDRFPGAYQVEVADVNGDGKPDIVAVGGGTCAWYENPTWTKRVISGPDRTPDVISSAAADLDGDGHTEVAIAFDFAMENPQRGKLLWAAPSTSEPGGWAMSSLGEFGSIHRLRSGDFFGDGRRELVVAAIFGTGCRPPADTAEPAEVMLAVPQVGLKTTWTRERIGGDPVLHAIEVVDFDADGRDDLLTAGNSGVIVHRRDASGGWSHETIVPGAPGTSPNRGASEVHLGMLGDGRRFVATLEPWHGSQVVVYPGTGQRGHFGPRTVIDDTLDQGHALWVVDVDGDGTDEVFAGHRGKDARVSVYRFDGQSWVRTVIDRQITAQDLRGGDIDRDGVPDVVAVGGASHNVVWYRPVRPRAAAPDAPKR
jgi:hypothetical protein